ncbi:hypothetical protein O0L34_g6901 [Tuta absoluta]|nr:hypothetical protein O0L34_g6901 [Tuta absoluta]
MRKKWMRAIKRDNPPSNKSCVYCCEDHFDVENDMENYIRFKLVGGRIQLKKGVVPHKLQCQRNTKEKAERFAVEKRNRIQYIEKCKVNPKSALKESTSIGSFTDSSSLTSAQYDPEKDLQASEAEDAEWEQATFKNHMQKAALLCISREPQLLLGLPKQCYFCINLLCETTKSIARDVMISLKKIRLHQSNAVLALDFGLSETTVSKVIRHTIPDISSSMKSIIYFPPSTDVLLNLPIPFRKRYSQVQSIIDCFEIQIEKPTNAVKQALTWSDYKSCNTLKYLISITPDGFINYISEGYGGRTSDSVIFKDCGILQVLPKGAAVMADRGLKNVANLLQKHGHSLIRPPSVSTQVKPTKQEVMETIEIAAIRIHVERAIGRLRTFGFMLPHACVDSRQIDLLDYVVITACGIVNLQNPAF